ncbi:MAG: Holliday junction resolvase RuvX [Firmicutes bacterium]|nr:Holliday junction resolvase RuvX [Bacillota bacterium]
MKLERIMALDVGDKWIGVAISDETQSLVTPHPPVRRSVLANDLDAILNLVKTWNVRKIVVGLPLNMNASIGPQAQKTLSFVHHLQIRADCDVITWDERLTTRQAERLLVEQDVRRNKRKQLIDGLAAALILENYLAQQHAVRQRKEITMADDKDVFGTPMEDEDEIITLTDENGKEHEFVVVDVIEVEEKEYAILLPIDTEEEEEAEAVILRLEKDAEGDDVLVDIDDDQEWEKVAQAYEELLDEDDEDDDHDHSHND